MDPKSLLNLNFPGQPRTVSESIASEPSPFFQQSLADAKLWCSLQTLTATSPETPDTVRRRDLIAPAGALLQRLQSLPWEDRTKHPAWVKATELFQEADMNSLALLEHQLRTPTLAPTSQAREATYGTETFFRESLLYVVTTRAALLADLRATKSGHEQSGKLLLYWPHENLACGAARFSSNGFFDDDNTPPWDTWVDYKGGVLTSWVPEILIPWVQEGIDANPEECIRWK